VCVFLSTQSSQIKGSFSHAFGAVCGPGETILGGPYSYALVIVDSIQKLKYKIDGYATDPCNHIDGICGGFALQVTSGRLVAMVFAWN
jgi:hypothetical protein